MDPLAIIGLVCSGGASALSVIGDSRARAFAEPVRAIPDMIRKVQRRAGNVRGQARAVGAWVDDLDDAIPGADQVMPEAVRDAWIVVGVWIAESIAEAVERGKAKPADDDRPKVRKVPAAVSPTIAGEPLRPMPVD